MAGKDKSIAGAIEAGVRGTERKPQYRRIYVLEGLAWTVENDAKTQEWKRRYQYVLANSKTTRYRMWPEKQLVY